MRELPSGTVTFLFSDIEGSTRLLDELGAEAYAGALAEHRRVMRDAFAAHGGVEVDTQGDAFFVAFPEAVGAVRAAEQAQAALAGGPIRVRMGIHSGEPLLTEEGYVGIDVHRGARVMSAGHGGQVLVSQATYALLEGDRGLVELGRHRLKDLTEPQPLYQLGGGEFPPLKTLYQTNLPVQPTPLVGREAELAEVLALLRESRLLTLTGAGGSGKTRLALQAAAELVEEFKDGVWWVPLAALRDPELVEPTIAQVVGAKDGLAEHLRSKQMLLLLDNFEQLIEAGLRMADLVSHAHHVRVLVTSRERLTLSAEQEYPVPTLVPTEAVALFTSRARQLRPAFQPDDDVEDICRRLDGLPLALELAAARVKVLTPAQILERLGRSLDLLTAGARDAPERQRTLRATIEWSYELLNPEQRHLFARLAVFAGSFDLGAGEAICDAHLDALQGLVDKSLLRQTDGGRFFLLETIREFALERLEETPAAPEIRHRHAQHYLQLAEQADPEIRDRGDLLWLERLESDHPNLREALDNVQAAGDAMTALQLTGALAYFWWVHGYLSEGRRRLDAALELSSRLGGRERGRVLNGAAALALHAGDLFSSRRYSEEGLEIWRRLDDWDGIVRSLNELGKVATAEEEFDNADRCFAEALDLARDRDPLWVVTLAINRGEALLGRGDPRSARSLFEEAVADARAREYPIGLVIGLLDLARVALALDDSDLVREALREALSVAVELEFKEQICIGLSYVASLVASGQPYSAAVLLGATEAMGEEFGFEGDDTLVGGASTSLRNVLGESEAFKALAEGRLLHVQEAVEYALACLD